MPKRHANVGMSLKEHWIKFQGTLIASDCGVIFFKTCVRQTEDIVQKSDIRKRLNQANGGEIRFVKALLAIQINQSL